MADAATAKAGLAGDGRLRVIVRHDFLPPGLARELEQLLPSRGVTKAMRQEFIEGCSRAAQEHLAGQDSVKALAEQDSVKALAEAIESFEKVATGAKRLRGDLSRLERFNRVRLGDALGASLYSDASLKKFPHLSAIFNSVDAAAMHAASGVRRLDELLQCVELACHGLAEFHPLTKGHSAADAYRRGFVMRLANVAARVFGKWPPPSREAWFSRFARRLAEHAGIKLGAALVERSLRSRHLTPVLSPPVWVLRDWEVQALELEGTSSPAPEK